MENQYKKAYKEVYVILNNCSKEDYEKVPKKIINQIELNMDKNYEYNLSDDCDIETQPMLRETLAILSIIYRDYWATEEQRKMIIEYQKNEMKKLEDEKIIKHIASDDMFKGKERQETKIHL